jgi:hypothetical protein
MGQIIDFRAGGTRDARVRELSTEGARILFFTGVRYERMPDVSPADVLPKGTGPEDKAPPRTRRTRKRRA